MRQFTRTFLLLSIVFFLVFKVWDGVQAQQSSKASFSINNFGGVSMVTAGAGSTTSVGYAAILPNSISPAPSGVAIFGYRQNNVLISETGVPATPSTFSGRIYAEMAGVVNTGVAIANPNTRAVTVTFYFTGEDSVSTASATTSIAAGGQIARFLNESPFNGSSSFVGTFTYNADAPVAVIALRQFTNERSEPLLTTLPVTSFPASTGGLFLPEFADGGGWTTQAVLVNPGDITMAGSLRFFSQGTATSAAQPASVTIDGVTGDTFNYAIPAKSSRRFRTSGFNNGTLVGSVRIAPNSNTVVPSGLAIFNFKREGITVSEAGVPASNTGQAFRMYAESTISPSGPIKTGVAIVNPAPNVVTATFELVTLAGASSGLTGSAQIPANGQISVFLDQIQGFESLQTPFQGVLRISTVSPNGLAVVGLRARYNERSDFLITTTPPTNETTIPIRQQYFPDLADGGGYTTQFVLFNGTPNPGASGSIQFFNQSGGALNTSVTVTPTPTQTPAALLPKITAVTPSSPTVSTASQTITITGVNFQPGYGVILTPPKFGGGVQTFTQTQLQAPTSTSFQVQISAGQLGAYGIQVQNINGDTSDVFNFNAQFRTSGTTWIPEGVRLSSSNGGIADVAALQLTDGRWRLIFNSIQSAISTDGLALTVESPSHGLPNTGTDGNRYLAHLPRLFKLPNGQWRAYYGCACTGDTPQGIYSAISADEGLTWTPEAGARILQSVTGRSGFLSGLSVVSIGPSKWRGYFSTQSNAVFPGVDFPMYSATSTDLMNWTMDSGIRIGAGAAVSGAALHVKAIANNDGSTTLYYWRPGFPGGLMYASTSMDGLTFTSETLIESLGSAGDPDVVPVGNGLRMYYNWGDDSGGAIYSAISPTGARF